MRGAVTAIAGMLLGACAHTAAQRCVGSPADRAAVEQAVRGLYAALAADDIAAYRRLTTPDFYAFDVGRRYDRNQLAELVLDAHRRGVQLYWNVGTMDTHIGCRLASATWENRGSAGVPPKLEPVLWLESAVLVKESGEWKLVFLHATRAQQPEAK